MRALFAMTGSYVGSGAVKSAISIAEALLKSETDFVYVVLPSDLGACSALCDAKIPHCVVPSYEWVCPVTIRGIRRMRERFGRYRRNRASIKRIRSIIREQRIDIVYINSCFGYVGANAAKREKIPFVWHVREFLLDYFHMSYFSKRYSRHLFSKASKIVCTCSALKQSFEREMRCNNIICVHNGIDEGLFFAPTHKIFQAKVVKAAIVGTVCREKGHYLLADAVALLKNTIGIELVVSVVGDENEPGSFEKYVRKIGVSEFFRNYGYVSNVGPLLRETDILFMCSKKEGFGRTTVEGMMSGCLVIAAGGGGTSDIVNAESGVLFNGEDPKDLADKITLVLSNRTHYETVAAKGRERSVRLFSLTNYQKNMYDVFAEAVANRNDSQRV